ncbi:MAG TPA: ABC transporter substrate-binding protein [Chloroflexota bacterium]|jgi:branched-chain amino acid transport system substrate-binding protein
MRSRSSWPAVAVIGLALIGCGGAAPVSPPASASLAASSAPAPKPVASASASPAAVSSPAASAAASVAPSSATIKVGLIETLTGPLANSGKDNLDAYNLYLSSTGNKLAGKSLDVVVVDDGGQPDAGLTKTKQLVENDKVAVLMGVHSSAVCYPVAQYANQVQIPFLVTGNCGGMLLTTDPKIANPYTARFTDVATADQDPMADWASAKYKKAILITTDFAAGYEQADAFASAFVKRGGKILQEMHPTLGTTDFGPYIAQFSQDADSIVEFLPGIDALRFMEQYSSYAGKTRPQMLDLTAQIVAGPNLAQLKTKADGVIANKMYTEAADFPENQAMQKAWAAKYPGRPMSADVANGYAGAQILEAALKKVNGDLSDKQKFLQAVYNMDVVTGKGRVKLDDAHDIVENMYIFQEVPQGDSVAPKLVKTYELVGRTWDRTAQELANFPFGKLKGKWPTITADQIPNLKA